MILILEGCNGVGKSSAAMEWGRRMGAPTIRPFRPSPSFHFTGKTEVEQELGSLGVPVNTYVDDLYVADITSNIVRVNPSFHAVLDRSLPSALAYNNVPDGPKVLEYWQRLLARPKAVRYVWMVCPYSIAAQRVAARGYRPPLQSVYEALEASFHDSYSAIQLPKTIIDTGQTDAAEVVEQLCRLSMS